MPRDSSGNYDLPAGNPVVTGTVIEANWANTTMADIGNELTSSLDRSGRGGMLEPLRLADGTAANPALGFTSDLNLGLFRPAGDTLGFTAGGVEALRVTGSEVEARNDAVLLVSDGDFSAPGLAFAADTNTGLFRNADNQLDITLGGAYRASFDADGLLLTSGANVGLNLYNASATPGRRRVRLVQHSTGEFRIQRQDDAGVYISDELRHPPGEGWQFGQAEGGAPSASGNINAEEIFFNGRRLRQTWDGVTYTAPGASALTMFNALAGGLARGKNYTIAVGAIQASSGPMQPRLRFSTDTTVQTGASYTWTRAWVNSAGFQQEEGVAQTDVPLAPSNGWRHDVDVNVRIYLDGLRVSNRPFYAVAWGWDVSSRPTVVWIHGQWRSVVAVDGIQLRLLAGTFNSSVEGHITRGMT